MLFLNILFSREAIADDSAQRKEAGLDSPFGVLEFLHWNHAWNNYKYPDKEALARTVSLMKEANVSWVRMDFLWDEIEPEQGNFKFEKYDTIVNLLTESGINVLGILNYNTPWASQSGEWNYPPSDNTLYVNYAEKVIARYKGKVKYWEIWNEPDSHIYWSNQDGLKSYCGLLKAVYPAAKKANPECLILNGGFAKGLMSVNRLYDNGAKDYFDILNIHIFESPLTARSIHAVKAYPRLSYKVMQRNGDGHKKIWVTEIGCPGVKRWQKVNNWWLGKNPTESRQAKWLKEVYTALLENENVEKVFWAFFRDCKEHWKNGTDNLGMVRWDFSKKPAFKAYKETFTKRKKRGGH